MSDTLVVNEIYLSLQGESTFAGLPCIFVRLTACNLRCSYCDTAYAFTEGQKKSLTDIRAGINRLAQPFQRKLTAKPPARRDSILDTELWTLDSVHRLPLVELTGGEPLLQENSL